MEDENLLKRMHRSINEATLVDPEEQSGRLTIDHALQVFGECVKNTPETPNLSNTSTEIFKRRNSESVIDDGKAIRNVLSHSRWHRYLAEHAIQSEKGLFTRVQNDLKILRTEIWLVLCCIKGECMEQELEPKNTFPAIAEYRTKFKEIEIGPSARQDIHRILNKAANAHENSENEEACRKIKLQLDRKRDVHDLKLKINGNYKENKHKLEPREKLIVEKELRARRTKGPKLLKKTAAHYGEFLREKKDIREFAVSCKLSDDQVESLSNVYEKIKSQHCGRHREELLNESIKKIEVSEGRCNDLAVKIKRATNHYDARVKLTSFFDCLIDLTKEKYKAYVDSLNTKEKTKSDLIKLYEDVTEAAVAESLPDDYGKFVDTGRNKKLTKNQICTAVNEFLGSLQLEQKEEEWYKESIIIAFLEEQFPAKLNMLKQILGNVETQGFKNELKLRYENDGKLKACVEMILLDLCEIYTLRNHDSDSSVRLFRNRLAHGDEVTSMEVISWAIRFTEKAESC